MKKVLFLMVLMCVVVFRAEASVFINENYTGNVAAQAGDTGFGPTQLGFNFGGGLGGQVRNSYAVKRATQFTVGLPSTVNYLAISGVLVPSMNVYDSAISDYVRQRVSEGATPEQIGLEINGNASIPPLFVGPAQNMEVKFSLIRGSVPYAPGNTNQYYPMPGTEVLSTASYQFYTDNSRNNKEFNNLLIPWSPFETSLNPGEDYWIVAEDPKFSGTTLRYTTKLAGDVTTPEPASLLLMGGGLAGMIWRRRKNSKR